MLAMRRTSPLEYLGYPHFAVTFLLIITLHFLVLFVWSQMPHMKIIDIPVKAMDIRLGDSDVQEIEDENSPQPTSDNSALLESAMARMIRKMELEKPIKKPVPKPVPKKVVRPSKVVPPKVQNSTSSASKKISSPRQFVRFRAAKKKTEDKYGSVLGNSTSSKALIKSRYEQTISLWIQKFKIYPRKARALGMQGSTVVRIRIDRRGNIRYSALEGNTGYKELDRAALDMVRRANPVPAVPKSYPAGEMFEYLIPVNFGIK